MMLMEVTFGEQTMVDIRATANKHQATRTKSACRPCAYKMRRCCKTVRYFQIQGFQLIRKHYRNKEMEEIDWNFDEVVAEAIPFLAGCYEYREYNMPDVHFVVWKTKVGRKVMKNMPKLQTLPPLSIVKRDLFMEVVTRPQSTRAWCSGVWVVERLIVKSMCSCNRTKQQSTGSTMHREAHQLQQFS